MSLNLATVFDLCLKNIRIVACKSTDAALNLTFDFSLGGRSYFQYLCCVVQMFTYIGQSGYPHDGAGHP